MLIAAVTALVACALAPWWAARSQVVRRLSVIAGATSAQRSVRRRGRQPAPPDVDVGVLLSLLAAAMQGGAALPRALHAVGQAIGGPDGVALERVAAALLLGSTWTSAWADTPDRLAVIRRALGPAWEHGAPPAQALRVTAAQTRADRRAAATEAAARLAVRLVVPLGVCFLPAFILIGLVPLLISLGAGVVD